MRKLRPWQTLEVEHLQDCAVFRVGRTLARSPRTGRAHHFYRIDSTDWVNVVPVTPDDRIVCVRQFRHGSGAITLEIPGGMVDPGESPAEAARREVLEETGYGGGVLEELGVVNPNPALFGNRCHTFALRDVRPEREIANEGTEETEVVLVPKAELHARLARGEIDHALVVAGLFWFALREGPLGDVPRR